MRIATTMVLACTAPALKALPPLGAYDVDPRQVSVSGFSSGAFMAQQLAVAYSSRFMGVGVFAGGFYDCWRTVPSPGCAYPNTPSIAKAADNMNAWSGTLIDPVSNIAKQKIYVFIGTNDTVVGPNTAGQVVNLYKTFAPAGNIRYDNTNPATHAFPTDIDSPGINPCGGNGITNCGFDGAGTVLQWIYGPLNPPNNGALSGSLLQFDQGAFALPGIGMDSEGWIYVPKSCANAGPCRLHIALHGCSMSYALIGNYFIAKAGYNRWADTNNIIVLYPQTLPDSKNSPPPYQGCWDFQADYGLDYDQKSGAQLMAMASMTTQIVSGHVQAAVEYYYAAWNYYFETAFTDEIALLDGGAFGGVWNRTGETFNVWASALGGSAPTCRFFSTAFAPKSSHFYTPFADECAIVKANPAWQYEAIAFYIQQADANGLCTPPLVALYRLYNNGMGGAPNHRYTTSLAVFNQMVALGWVFEGNGNTKVFACVPA